MANADELKRQNEMDNLNLLRQQVNEQAAMINELREAVQSADIIICGLGIHHAGERQLAQDGVLMLREMLGKTSSQFLTAHDNAIRAEVAEECAMIAKEARGYSPPGADRVGDVYDICSNVIETRILCLVRKYKGD